MYNPYTATIIFFLSQNKTFANIGLQELCYFWFSMLRSIIKEILDPLIFSPTQDCICGKCNR